MLKTNKCPECGCSEYVHKNELGEGFRMCKKCHQEWWTDIDYNTKNGDKMSDLIKELKRWLKTPMPTTTTALHNELHKVAGMVNEAIAALEAPKPFDVLQHLRDGGMAQMTNESSLYLKVQNRAISWFNKSNDGILHDINANDLLSDFKPYEPEPSAEQLIEDARIAAMNFHDPKFSNVVEDVDKITKALDAFEKLTLETGE